MKTTAKQKHAWGRIPGRIRSKILDVARRLPREESAEFVRKALQLIALELKSHPRTALWAVLGYGAGEMLEHVPVLGWLTAGWAGELLGLAGAGYGFRRDRLEGRIDALINGYERAGARS